MANRRSTVYRIVIAVAVVIAAYFIMVEVQTRLGKKALAATGLVSLPLEDALIRAAGENKLVLADLSAIWCPSCRALDKNVFADSRVKDAITQKFVFSRIEYESPEGEAFMERYDVHRFPTLLLLQPGGDVVRQLPITSDPDSFLQALIRPRS